MRGNNAAGGNMHARNDTFSLALGNNVNQQAVQNAMTNQMDHRQQQQFELDEIKVTTQSLTQEINSMRKFIEDLHISASEKDAEIIRLKMHLGDEKAKSRTTRQGS